MSVSETLLNATLVLIPVWLGVIRYLTKEVDFESERTANMIGLGIVIILIGILYSMAIAIESLVAEQPNLKNGLYVLLGTLALTGIGGVLFIIREIPEVSSSIVAGIPVLILIITGGAILVPQIITVPSLSFSFIMSLVAIVLALLELVTAIFPGIWERIDDRTR